MLHTVELSFMSIKFQLPLHKIKILFVLMKLMKIIYLRHQDLENKQSGPSACWQVALWLAV